MRVSPVRAALTATLLSAISLSAAPATAGGPTSALLSIPGAGSTASLYYTDPEYDELAGLVGVAEPGGTFGGSASEGHEFGPGVTVTWLVHDVEPWRVDRIYLGGKDGPWISTQVSGPSGSLWESPVLWHQPEQGKRLADLLDGLGMGTGASKNTSFDGVAGAPVPESADTTPATTATTAPTAAAAQPDRAEILGWALAGLVGGVLMTLAWTRYRGRAGTDAEEGQPSLDGSQGYTEVLAR